MASGDKMQDADVRILKILQNDGRITNQELAEAVHLAPSPCWRRTRKLEEDGVITGYRAVVDRQKIGLDVAAFVRVTIDSLTEVETHHFKDKIEAMTNVVACYQVAGDVDYLLEVVAPSLAAYEAAVTGIRRLPGIKSMTTMFVLDELKSPSPLPVGRSI